MTFNADRTRATLTLADGGTGDADNPADGVIRDPSGPGTPYLGPDKPGADPDDGDQTAGGDGGGGGCFIGSIVQ